MPRVYIYPRCNDCYAAMAVYFIIGFTVICTNGCPKAKPTDDVKNFFIIEAGSTVAGLGILFTYHFLIRDQINDAYKFVFKCAAGQVLYFNWYERKFCIISAYKLISILFSWFFLPTIQFVTIYKPLTIAPRVVAVTALTSGTGSTTEVLMPGTTEAR